MVGNGLISSISIHRNGITRCVIPINRSSGWICRRNPYGRCRMKSMRRAVRRSVQNQYGTQCDGGGGEIVLYRQRMMRLLSSPLLWVVCTVYVSLSCVPVGPCMCVLRSPVHMLIEVGRERCTPSRPFCVFLYLSASANASLSVARSSVSLSPSSLVHFVVFLRRRCWLVAYPSTFLLLASFCCAVILL